MVRFPNEIKRKSWTYTVVSLTPTNAEVKLLQSTDDSSIFVSLDRVRLCYDEMTDDVWTGTNKRLCKQKSIPTEDPKVKPVAKQTGPVTLARWLVSPMNSELYLQSYVYH